MKTYILKLAVILLMIFLATEAGAKRWIVEVRETSFFPNNLTHVEAQDTIVWKWMGGTHTTKSTTIPADALDWEYDLDLNNPEAEYVPTKNGTYNYVCGLHPEVTGRFTVSGAYGVSEVEKPGASVGPNPFYDRVTVTADPGISIASVKVFDLMGKMLMEKETGRQSTFTMDGLAGLIPGYYVFSFTTTDNRTFARRVIHR